MPTSTQVVNRLQKRSLAERLSLRAAIFWICVLSSIGWTAILALIYALV
jgi:hypothetical protein